MARQASQSDGLARLIVKVMSPWWPTASEKPRGPLLILVEELDAARWRANVGDGDVPAGTSPLCVAVRNSRAMDLVVASVTLTTEVTLFTTTWCGYCVRLKSQLERQGIDYLEVDIESDPDAAIVVAKANAGDLTVPTLMFADGSTLSNPSIAQVSAKLAPH
jgi:mycoredoxin